MATPSTSPDTSSTSTHKKYNLRNPLPLSAPQEQEVKQLYYKRVRAHCAPEIKAFAECAVNRTVTATWVCRQQRLAMNSCMLAHAKPEEEDRAREEWFASYEERRRAKDEELARVEKRRAEVIRMMREDEARRRAEDRRRRTMSVQTDSDSMSSLLMAYKGKLNRRSAGHVDYIA